MAKVTERQSKDRLTVLCDVSPPRGANLDPLDQAALVDADFFSVAYSPGKSVRLDSVTAAYLLQQRSGREASFTLACRDMNRLALQSQLLGAQALGLENVIVVGGDPFSESERGAAKTVDDFTSTGFIASICAMNEGRDARGLELPVPTDFCIGAAVDLGRDLYNETRLAGRKVDAGAHFLITQALFDPSRAEQFLELYRTLRGADLEMPVFFGAPVPHRAGLTFGAMPEKMASDLQRGRPGAEIALDLIGAFLGRGIDRFYLVPPILSRGRRGYEAASQVLEEARRL